ncbi:hypothetical protein [Nocardia sp. BMG51109]|uniref:hypothetical protein n=1 Tax=Nocardia sp. BMG51109 TaxID=1056816 RepID=UPI0004679ADE|nr:hypothetical protein [Nocardia sp. BMG51109]
MSPPASGGAEDPEHGTHAMPGATGYRGTEGPAGPGGAPADPPPAAPPPAAPLPPPVSGAAPVPPPTPGGAPASGAPQPPGAASGPPTAEQSRQVYGSAPPQGAEPYPTAPPPGPAGPPTSEWGQTAEMPSGYDGYGEAPPQSGQAPPQFGRTPPQAGAPAAPFELSVPDAIGYGWTRFRSNWMPWVAITLVGFIAYLAVTLVINVGNVDSLLPLVLIFLVASMVVWLLQAAMIRGGLAETDGTPPDFQAFFGFVNAGNVLLTALLVFVAAWIGALLCLLPALIVGFLCMFSLHFVIDRDQDPFTAIKSSVQLVVTNPGSTALLALAIVVMTLVSLLFCAIPLLVVGPISAISVTYAYRVLVGGLVVP